MFRAFDLKLVFHLQEVHTPKATYEQRSSENRVETSLERPLSDRYYGKNLGVAQTYTYAQTCTHAQTHTYLAQTCAPAHTHTHLLLLVLLLLQLQLHE